MKKYKDYIVKDKHKHKELHLVYETKKVVHFMNSLCLELEKLGIDHPCSAQLMTMILESDLSPTDKISVAYHCGGFFNERKHKADEAGDLIHEILKDIMGVTVIKVEPDEQKVPLAKGGIA
jgi:hypothetical protein